MVDHRSRHTDQRNVVLAMASGITGVCETSNDLFFFGGHFLDIGRKKVSTEATLKRLAAHSLGNTGLGVQKHFTKF